MPSLIPNVESGKFSTSKKKFLFQNHMNWDILQSWKIIYFYWKISTLVKIFSLFWTSKRAQIQSKWRNWKFFHFGGKFSTFKNLQKKKFFLQNCMNWNILQRSKIFHFWWKIFHFGEILFSASRPSRLPNFIPKREIGIFSTLVENFPLTKMCTKKKKFFCRIAWIGTFCRGNFFPKNRKFFHFSDFFENSENLFIWAYKCAKFQHNRRNFFSSFIIIMTTRCARGCAG